MNEGKLTRMPIKIHSIIVVSAANWAKYVGVESVQYIKWDMSVSEHRRAQQLGPGNSRTRIEDKLFERPLTADYRDNQ